MKELPTLENMCTALGVDPAIFDGYRNAVGRVMEEIETAKKVLEEDLQKVKETGLVNKAQINGLRFLAGEFMDTACWASREGLISVKEAPPEPAVAASPK